MRVKATSLSRALKWTLLAGTVSTPALCHAQAPLPGTPASSVSNDAAASGPIRSGGVEEIVVTAQRREQSLQDVPISITALSQSAIQANRIQDVRDLNALAPSLSIRLSSGGAQIPTITLRGLLTGAPLSAPTRASPSTSTASTSRASSDRCSISPTSNGSRS